MEPSIPHVCICLEPIPSFRHGHAQQTCSILAPVDARGPRSLATSRVNISIIIPKRLRESAASHRPLDDSSRMKACCA
jgi:hypothetical protein